MTHFDVLPDPANSILVTFIPDSNPRTTIRGVFVPAVEKGVPGKFTPFNPEDLGTKIPLQPTQGTMVPDSPGYAKPHGVFTPSTVSKDQPAHFMEDPKGSSAGKITHILKK
jgi:hypothetical protein